MSYHAHRGLPRCLFVEERSMKAEIIAVGTELLLGQIVDTNSAHIAQQLTTIGLDLHFKSTVGDNMERIKATLRNALSRSDLIITTGGIGPTLDDLTREAVAEVLGKPLVFQPALFDQITDFFTRLGRTTSPNNRKQAFIPEGAIPIENPVGTAPGFIAEQDGKAIITVPGVPHEMRYFMEHSVLPYLRTKLGIREVIVSRVLKLFGIGESLVDERLKDLIEEGTNPTIGLLAHTHIGEIHVRLTAKSAEQAQAEALNAALEVKVRERLGEFIFGVDEESYEGVLNALLVKAGRTLAVAETAFGSSVAQTLKTMEGSGQFFRLGVTVVTPETAQKLLSVPVSLWQEGKGVNAATGESPGRGSAPPGRVRSRIGDNRPRERSERAGSPDPHRPGKRREDGVRRTAVARADAVHRKPDDQAGPRPDQETPFIVAPVSFS